MPETQAIVQKNSWSIGADSMRRGFQKSSVWLALASEDISDQHKLTLLGPLWVLVSYFAFALTFIFIFGRSEGAENYASYVAIGLMLWLYMLEVITKGITLFNGEESMIKGTPLPLSVYVFRLSAQCIMRGAYALLGCAIILGITGPVFDAFWLIALVSILLLVLITPAAITLLAIIGAFFPDMRFVVSNAMRIGMFLTPVFWTNPGQDSIRAFLSDWNPFAWFLHLGRAPILDGRFPLDILVQCVALGIVLWLLAIVLLGRTANRIPFIV